MSTPGAIVQLEGLCQRKNPITPSGIEPATFQLVVQPVQSVEEDNSLLVTGLKMALTGVLISLYPDQEGNKLMFLSEWREFPSAPFVAGKTNLMTARVSMLLKSRASLTCFRACFLPGWARDLSAPPRLCRVRMNP